MSRDEVRAAVLDVLWPPCRCSLGACGRRIPVFMWDDGDLPTADDMEELADDIADRLLDNEGD